MAGEFLLDDLDLNFDSISHNGIYKCEQCSMLVPYRSLAEHIQLRHKSISDQIDDGQSILMTANQNGAPFRPQAPRPKFLDSDFDTTDTESIVTIPKNQRNANGAGAGGGGRGGGPNGVVDAGAPGKIDTRRKPVRGVDRFQAKRFAKLQAAREQQQANGQKSSNGTDATKPAAPQSRRKQLPTAMDIFSKNRSQSEVRTPQKINGIFAAGIGGNERAGNAKKFVPVRRSVSAQRTQAVPENFVHCKICSNLMHKDYVDDHIRRKHNVEEPATETNGTVNVTKMIVKGDDSSSSSSDSSDDVDVTVGAIKTFGKLNEDANGATDDNNNEVKAPAKKSKAVKVADKQKGFRRCTFCEAFMHTDYMAGHLIRKHKTEFIGASGITWLKYSDEQMNKFIQEGRLWCKNGALYIKSA